MADTTKTFNVNRNFNLGCLVELLGKKYKEQGFEVASVVNGKTYMVTFSKDESGIKKFVGLGQQITANFMMSSPDTLLVTFTDAEWTGKIIGLVIGWILCLIPFIMAIYGALRQSKLPTEIGQNIMMLIPAAEQSKTVAQNRPLNANFNRNTAPSPAEAKNNISNDENFCPNCGNKLKSGAKFCGKCGTKI